jgi:hypothetical protein
VTASAPTASVALQAAAVIASAAGAATNPGVTVSANAGMIAVLAQALNAVAKISFAWPPRADPVTITGVASGVAGVLALAAATVQVATVAVGQVSVDEIADGDSVLVGVASGTPGID